MMKLLPYGTSTPDPVYSRHLGQGYSKAIIDKNTKRSLRTISELNTSTARKFAALFTEALEMGVLLLLYSGARDYAEQWELRKKYLAGGPRAARPGESWHNFGRAVDLVPITDAGGADWETKLYPKIALLAEKHGLKWGGSFGDQPHFYDDENVSLWVLRGQTPGWQQYHNMEAGKPKIPGIPEQSIDLTKDNRIVVRNIILWTLGIGTVTFLGYKLIKRYGN